MLNLLFRKKELIDDHGSPVFEHKSILEAYIHQWANGSPNKV